MIKKIAITGPESTGKSILTEQLAKTFNSTWVPEYAREYLDQINRPYSYEDILAIARAQFQKMKDAVDTAGQFIFYDTELLVTKIWCDFKYGKCHPWILNQLNNQDIDLYLLMDIDLPWQPDPQREHPDKRKILFDLYQTEMEKRNWPYEVISGTGDPRLENALNAISKWFQ